MLSKLAKNRTHSEKTKVLISRALVGENNPFYNKNHSTETKIRIIEAKSAYPVYIYNSSKKLLAIFPSVGTLAKSIKSNHKTLINVIKEGILFRGEWYLLNIPYNISDTPLISNWYSKEGKELVLEINNQSHIKKAIFVYDVNKNFLGKYEGVTSAQQTFNISHNTIKKYALAGGSTHGYIFSYERLKFKKSGDSHRFFSTQVKIPKASLFDPWFVTGFTEGEGCFHLSVTGNNKLKLGWRVRVFLKSPRMKKIKTYWKIKKKFFGVGPISKLGEKSLQFKVFAEKDFYEIIKDFDKFPLITQKKADYELWKQVFNIIKNKEDTTQEGLNKIISLRASMNRGWSDKLRLAFPNIIMAQRPLLENKTIKDSNWLPGFTSAEGCFNIKIVEATTKIGETVKLEFQLAQHVRDEELIKSFLNYFGCGNYYVRAKKDLCEIKVTKLDDIIHKILPLFKKYPILGVKALDFADWCSVTKLMQEKEHLTKKGLDKIKKIQCGINTGRNN